MYSRNFEFLVFQNGSLSYYFFFYKFLSSKLSFTFEFFPVYTRSWLASPAAPAAQSAASGTAPVFSRPWAGPSASVLVGLLSAGCCLVPRAAGLAGACCRADLPAAGRTARAAAAPAWAAAEARLHRLGRQGGGRPHRYHRFQPRPFAGWLGGLAADDVCHHLSSGDSGGV